MAEYIKREDIVAKFQKLKDKCKSLKNAIYLDGVIAVLDSIPAADVAEVRHGRWIDGVCSECGFDAMYYKGVPAQVYTDYRPNCGARMDKEDEHETD